MALAPLKAAVTWIALTTGVVLLFVTVAVMVRGMSVTDQFAFATESGNTVIVSISRANVLFVCSSSLVGPKQWSHTVDSASDLSQTETDILAVLADNEGLGGWRPRARPAVLPRNRLALPGISYASVVGRAEMLRCSFWWVVFLCLLVDITIIRARLIHYFRRKGNRCSNCGYDLRGTPDRCPECGSVSGRR